MSPDSVKRYIRQNYQSLEWALGILVIALPAIAWFSQASLSSLSLREIFPPLGLIAFGLMWTHFVMGALRRYSGAEKPARDLYMPISMGLVLALIILHPGLLWLALYLEGLGLPPQSYLEAYSTQVGLVTLGSISLAIFLSFELKRFFGDKKWWRFVDMAQIAGMAAIFVHAIGLGRELQLDWFKAVWWVYGLSLVAAIVYSKFIYKQKK